MARKTLIKLLLLLILCEVLLVSVSEAKPWWSKRRRRCRAPKPPGLRWANVWKGRIRFQSRNSRTSIKHWRSQHSNCKEDRIHHFHCGYGPVSYHHGNCAWAGHYVNDFDKRLDYKCPHNGFITGVRSYFSTSKKDRRFNFRCCHVNSYKAHTCKTTLYQNYWDKKVDYWVPSGYYLVGVSSYHNNKREDRRWKFEICQFGKFNGK